MPELTKEEKIKLFEKLPKELRDFMESENTGAFLLYLGEKYNLEDEKVSLLSKIVGDVVLGITPITSLAQEINSKITSDAQTATNLARELYTELLAPVMAPAPSMPAVSAPVAPTAPSADRYREPTIAPEIVDLRKAPTPAPLPPVPKPAAPTIPAPQPPLIEAEPHKIPPSAPRPQYIMRPSGLPPTDIPDNVLDLRKDKGEF